MVERPAMHTFEDQLKRIQHKLPLAKRADEKNKVFGADRHEYFINPPISEKQLTDFENEYNVSLPESYKAFLTTIGNGGRSYQQSAAGPFYGIYPFGENIDELISDPKEYLSKPTSIVPGITPEQWKQLNRRIDDEELSNEEYDKERGTIFAGILPIGSQGCTYLHGIILNGAYRGKVVNLDMDSQFPSVTFEDHFLDWYERWLDEIISGDLLIDGPTWFGYGMGGTEELLLQNYFSSDETNYKSDCLSGLLNKVKLKTSTLEVIEKEYTKESGGIKKQCLQILSKNDYQRAKSYLAAFAETDLLTVFQFVYWYAKEKSSEWLPLIEKKIHTIEDSETLRFCGNLLKETKTDYGKLLVPFTIHADEQIRELTFYQLGQLKNKAEYTDAFVKGLYDESTAVLRITLQAVEGIKDKKLLEAYKNIQKRFPEEKEYILSNLNNRLKENGLKEVPLQKTNF